jgi:hypothetical protein
VTIIIPAVAEEPHQPFSQGEYPERQGTCGGKPSFLDFAGDL